MDDREQTIANRIEAGTQLARRLKKVSLDRSVACAFARGGVPVALKISRALKAPPGLVMVRKIGAPTNPEVALGAVVEGAVPQTINNNDIVRISGADEAFIERAHDRELAEMERRGALYPGRRERLDPALPKHRQPPGSSPRNSLPWQGWPGPSSRIGRF